MVNMQKYKSHLNQVSVREICRQLIEQLKEHDLDGSRPAVKISAKDSDLLGRQNLFSTLKNQLNLLSE